MLLSAAVMAQANHVLVQEGGYLMHASSDPNATCIMRKLGGWQGAANMQDHPISPDILLRMGVMELDLPGGG